MVESELGDDAALVSAHRSAGGDDLASFLGDPSPMVAFSRSALQRLAAALDAQSVVDVVQRRHLRLRRDLDARDPLAGGVLECPLRHRETDAGPLLADLIGVARPAAEARLKPARLALTTSCLMVDDGPCERVAQLLVVRCRGR
jgi:hypothetical protein